MSFDVHGHYFTPRDSSLSKEFLVSKTPKAGLDKRRTQDVQALQDELQRMICHCLGGRVADCVCLRQCRRRPPAPASDTTGWHYSSDR
jgi:hypothetical protein